MASFGKLIYILSSTMPSTIIIERLRGPSPGEAVRVSSVRFRSDDGDAQDQTGAVTLPQPVHTTLAQAVQGRDEPQSVDVASGSLFSPSDFVIVDAGTNQQEVVRLLSVTGEGHLNALFRRNHPAAAKLSLVSASYAKTLAIRLTERPGHSVANLSLRRVMPLPKGVYDQWRIPISYEEASSSEPWVSDAGVFYSRVPDEAPATLAPGPWTAEGVLALVEIQWLFTSPAESASLSAYRFSWDEA